MFPIRELIQLLLQMLPIHLQRPDFLLVVGVVLFLVHRQYRRLEEMEERFFGRPKVSAARRTLVALLFGMAGGILGTAVFLGLGLSLNDMGVWYLWPVALALFFLHPRFICFAYAGGLISLVHLLTGWPAIYVPSLMGLVAVLHLVEAVLIWLHGAWAPTPIYVRRPGGAGWRAGGAGSGEAPWSATGGGSAASNWSAASGAGGAGGAAGGAAGFGLQPVVGGFTLQQFWPLPFVALFGLLVPGEIPAEHLIAMPDWWPLIGSLKEGEGQQLVYLLLPVVAALGYGDIALARSPRQKARRSALVLLAYSLTLMSLALLAHHVPVWSWVAALFSPLAHEGVIVWGRRSEERGRPRYVKGEHPVILDVMPGSPAQRVGLRSGDVVVEVNGVPVHSKVMLRSLLIAFGGGQWTVERGGRRFQVTWPPGIRWPVGVVLVPEPFELPLVDLTDRSRFARLRARLQARIRTALTWLR